MMKESTEDFGPKSGQVTYLRSAVSNDTNAYAVLNAKEQREMVE